MNKYYIGYSRPIGDLTEIGAVTKLRQDANISGQPQSNNKPNPERKHWLVMIKDNHVKIYGSYNHAEQDLARRPEVIIKKNIHNQNIFKTIQSSPTNIHGGRISSPIFHQEREISRIVIAEENLASAQTSYSEFEVSIKQNEPTHIKERFNLLKEIASIKLILAEKDLELARFDEMQNKKKKIKELEEELILLQNAI